MMAVYITRQTDRYFVDRKKVNPDLFVIEIELCTCIYNIVYLLLLLLLLFTASNKT